MVAVGKNCFWLVSSDFKFYENIRLALGVCNCVKWLNNPLLCISGKSDLMIINFIFSLLSYWIRVQFSREIVYSSSIFLPLDIVPFTFVQLILIIYLIIVEDASDYTVYQFFHIILKIKIFSQVYFQFP